MLAFYLIDAFMLHTMMFVFPLLYCALSMLCDVLTHLIEGFPRDIHRDWGLTVVIGLIVAIFDGS